MRMGVGTENKVVLRFRAAFWPSRADHAYINCTDARLRLAPPPYLLLPLPVSLLYTQPARSGVRLTSTAVRFSRARWLVAARSAMPRRGR